MVASPLISCEDRGSERCTSQTDFQRARVGFLSSSLVCSMYSRIRERNCYHFTVLGLIIVLHEIGALVAPDS